VATLIQGMNTVNIDITFHQHELPPLEMRKKNDSFMIISIYNRLGIKISLIENSLTLNVCSVTLLDRLGVDKSRIEPDFLSIQGFDNVGKQLLGLITFPITI
jgi:hypothetical protein